MAKKRVRFTLNVRTRTTAIGLSGSTSFSAGQEVSVDEKLLEHIKKSNPGMTCFDVLDKPKAKPKAKFKGK